MQCQILHYQQYYLQANIRPLYYKFHRSIQVLSFTCLYEKITLLFRKNFLLPLEFWSSFNNRIKKRNLQFK